jgi:hypothetical protein
MRLYLLKDSTGRILALHTDKTIIRTLFFEQSQSQQKTEIWIMDIFDETGIVKSYTCLLEQI